MTRSVESISNGRIRRLVSQSMILGIEGSAVAKGQLVRDSLEYDRELGLEPGSCERMSGVRSRSLSRDETVQQFAARALSSALDQAGLRLDDLDLLIFASASRHQPIPCTAAMVQRELGAASSSVPAFDIDATCLSFLQAFDVAGALLTSDRYQRIAIVGAEISSRFLDPSCAKTYPLIADGAVAFLLNAKPIGYGFSQLGSSFQTHAAHAELCEIRGGFVGIPAFDYSENKRGDFLFKMDGRNLYRTAAQLLPPFLSEFEQKCGLSIPEFGLVIPHQASRSALDLLARRLRIHKDRMIDILSDHGNQIAVSIPTALHHALVNGRVHAGQNLVMVGTGAGLGLGAIGLRIHSTPTQSR